MKYSELEKLLRKAGCYEVSRDGAHPIWYSPTTKNYFPTGHHKNREVANGTLRAILKKAGL